MYAIPDHGHELLHIIPNEHFQPSRVRFASKELFKMFAAKSLRDEQATARTLLRSLHGDTSWGATAGVLYEFDAHAALVRWDLLEHKHARLDAMQHD